MIGIDPHLSFIGQIERGSKEPSLKTLGRIAQALGIDPGCFIKEPECGPKVYPLEKKLGGLIAGRPMKEQLALYQTIKIFARQMGKMGK